MSLARVFSLSSLLLALASNGACLASCPHSGSALQEPKTETLAGSGIAGIADGTLSSASFVAPTGIAVGSDASIYVTDQLAHSIRRIHNGRVQVVAGISPSALTPQQREGGYVDGPVSLARFNHPSGIAVAKDGTLYVADAWNHVIRKIQHGIVSTFAGSGVGNRDGIGVAAQFTLPQDLALDDSGTLYVADRGVGIRKITSSGKVETLAGIDGNVCGVAARGSSADLLLAYTDDKTVTMLDGTVRRSLAFTAEREPEGEGHLVGSACRVAILDKYVVAVTDQRTSSVRFIRLKMEPPVGSGAMVRTLVGVGDGENMMTGGYREGASGAALADLPAGIAVLGNDTLIFADSGNRRIRVIKNVDARGPLPANFTGLADPQKNYRIAVFGDSYAFHNVMWSDSIQGQIEGGLLRSSEELGLKRCPYVSALRFSGIGISNGIDFLSTYLSDGEADLVVFLVNSTTLQHDLENHPAFKVGEAWKAIVREKLAALGRTMANTKTKLLIVPVPHGSEASPFERTFGGEEFTSAFQRATVFEDTIASSGVKTLKLLRMMERAEESPQRVPLYNLVDPHPTAAGSAWIGKAIFKEIAAWRPWSN